MPTFTDASSQKKSFFTDFLAVERKDYLKAFSLCVLKFLISFVFIILKNKKEPFVVMREGAEIIAPIKSFVIFPASVLLVLGYNQLNNRFSKETIFYGILLFFVGFFLVYIFVLLPYEDFLTPHKSADRLTELFPRFKKIIAVYRYWTRTLFFLIAEMWGQLIIFLMFWGTANELFTSKQAKKLYDLFICAGCMGGLVGLILIKVCNAYNSVTVYQGGEWVVVSVDNNAIMYQLLYMVIFAITLLLGFYYWLNKHFEKQQHIIQEVRTKLSFWESMKYIVSNRYLLAVATMVLGCTISMSLVDITFKGYVKKISVGEMDYTNYITSVKITLHIISIFFCLFVTRNLMHFFGWKVVAYVAPVVILVTGSFFFICSYFREYIGWLDIWGIGTVKLLFYFGAFQVLASFVVKYCFFDGSKEMVYMNMDLEAKRKGKSAIDVIGSRLGKSFSGFFHQSFLLIMCTDNVFEITHLLLVCLVMVCTAWLYNVAFLAKTVSERKKSDVAH